LGFLICHLFGRFGVRLRFLDLDLARCLCVYHEAAFEIYAVLCLDASFFILWVLEIKGCRKYSNLFLGVQVLIVVLVRLGYLLSFLFLFDLFKLMILFSLLSLIVPTFHFSFLLFY